MGLGKWRRQTHSLSLSKLPIRKIINPWLMIYYKIFFWLSSPPNQVDSWKPLFITTLLKHVRSMFVFLKDLSTYWARSDLWVLNYFQIYFSLFYSSQPKWLLFLVWAKNKSFTPAAYKSMVPFPFGNISFPDRMKLQLAGLSLGNFVEYVLTWDIDEYGLF